MLYIIHNESDHSLASSTVMNRFKFPCLGRSKSRSRLWEEEAEGKEAWARDVRAQVGRQHPLPTLEPGVDAWGLRLQPREGAPRRALAVLRGRDLRSAERLWLCSLLCSSLFLGRCINAVLCIRRAERLREALCAGQNKRLFSRGASMRLPATFNE